MSLLLKLYLAFLKVGTFGFGGGYAILSLIQQEVVTNNSWISTNDFLDIISISQMTPGPIAINCATFTGYRVAGVIGSIVATLGVVTTSFILVTLAYIFFQKFKESNILNSALSGMKPALIGLIISVFISLSKTSYIDLKSLIIGGIIALLLFKSKIHPIIIIIIAAFLGLIFYGPLNNIISI